MFLQRKIVLTLFTLFVFGMGCDPVGPIGPTGVGGEGGSGSGASSGSLSAASTTSSSIASSSSSSNSSSSTGVAVDPLEVIVSGAGETPVVYKEVSQTTCALLAHIEGEWNFYVAESDGQGGSLPEKLVSSLDFSRVDGHAELLAAVESLASGATTSFLNGAPFIMLWELNNCTLITADSSMQPTFSGQHMSIEDADHLYFYGFAGSYSRLVRVQ